MDEDDYKLYILAELYYKQDHNNIPENELFPREWYSIKDYKTKTEILGESLKNNIRIEDTQRYVDIQEGVKLRDSH